MTESDVLSALGRLLDILSHSMPMYLEEAKPWSGRDSQRAQEILAEIVADQRALAQRVAQAVLEYGGHPDAVRYPMEFTALNDLSLDFLLRELVTYQEREVASIERCAADLAEVPPLCSLAKDVLDGAKRHLHVLKDLLSPP